MENHAPASTTLGEIPRERCSFVIERRTEFDVYVTRKNFTDPNCMFCFCVSMQLHISNTEHVQCACNDYKLQELTFKCLNLYFVRVIRTLKGGIVGLQIYKMINLGSNVIVYKLKHCVLHFEVNMMTF